MAGAKIRGITIEIGGDTSAFQKSLKSLDKDLKTTQDNLKDVDKLLKLNPGNVDLLRQKQKGLQDAIGGTKKRLDELKDAQKTVAKGTAEWDALQREIIDTEGKLDALQREYKSFGSIAKQQLKAVGGALNDTGGKVEAFGRKLTPVSAAAGAIGGALLKMGYDAITSADDLTTLSQQTGISTDDLQKMKYAADLVDVSVEDISGAIRKMKTKLDPANETFAELGVAVTNADGSLRDATDVFYDTLGALSAIQNETERDQVAMSLFGKGADSLAGIIDDGGAALRAYGDEAERLGLILDKDTLDGLNATNDAIDKAKMEITGTIAQIGADLGSVLAPAISKAGELISKVTDALRKLSPEQTGTILKIVGIVAAIAPVIMIGGKLISGIGSLVSVIGTVVGVLGGPLTLAIGAVVAIGVVLYKNWDKIKEVAQSLWSGMKTGWEKVKSGVSNVMGAIKSNVQQRLDNVREAFVENGGGIKGAVAAGLEAVKQYYGAAFDALNALTGGRLAAIKEKFEAVFNSVKSVVKSAIDYIKGLFNFNWTLPKIKLPHFEISPPGWVFGDLMKGKIPKLSVEWYKKAYDDPVVFTSPTVLATPGGYKGFGDGAGAEIVMGLDKLREVVGAAGGVTINVYAQPGQDVNRLADAIQARFVALDKQRRLAHA